MGHGPDDCPRQIGKGGDVAGVGRGRVDGALCVVRPVWRLRYGGLQAAPEAVVLAVHLQDVDVAGEPAQQRPGEPLRAEDPGPLVDGQVDVHQDGARSQRWLKTSRSSSAPVRDRGTEPSWSMHCNRRQREGLMSPSNHGPVPPRRDDLPAPLAPVWREALYRHSFPTHASALWGPVRGESWNARGSTPRTNCFPCRKPHIRNLPEGKERSKSVHSGEMNRWLTKP